METWIFMKHLSWNCRKQKQSRNWCVLVVNFFPFYSYSICFTVLFCKDMNDRSYVHISIFFHIFPLHSFILLCPVLKYLLKKELTCKECCAGILFIIFLFTCNFCSLFCCNAENKTGCVRKIACVLAFFSLISRLLLLLVPCLRILGHALAHTLMVS